MPLTLSKDGEGTWLSHSPQSVGLATFVRPHGRHLVESVSQAQNPLPVQGFCAALGGIVMMTRMFSASGNLALDGPLNIIPMVIVGGTAFSGGKGGAINTLWGVILMNIIYNAMSMFSLQANMQEMVKGLILLIIIVADKYMENRNQKV